MQSTWNPSIPAAIDKMLELHATSPPLDRGLGPGTEAVSPPVCEVQALGVNKFYRWTRQQVDM